MVDVVPVVLRVSCGHHQRGSSVFEVWHFVVVGGTFDNQGGSVEEEEDTVLAAVLIHRFCVPLMVVLVKVAVG